MPTTICPCRVSPTQTAVETPVTQPSYAECCQPLHQGDKQAENAEMLMRSRYSAFVKVLPEYIVATTLPAQQSFLDKQAIQMWAEETNWAGLEIKQYTPKLGKRHAQVAFNAYYHTLEDGSLKLGFHPELSGFVKAKAKAGSKSEQWYFLDPTVSLKVTQKQPCICGSGEKFKRCCGQFIA